VKAIALVCLAALAAAPPPLVAAVVRVNQNGGDFTTIQEGIDAAGEGDTVLVWPGIYTGPLNRGLDFHGADIVVRSLEGLGTVTIDCEDQDRAFHLHALEDTASAIDGFTIIRGLAEHGGAIRCYRAAARLTNLTLIQNRASSCGGAIHLEHSDSVIRHVTFIENWAGSRGGGLSAYHSSPIVSDAGFKGNVGRIGGGALYVTRSSPVFRDSRFYSNRAALAYGGVASDYLGSAQFERCLFQRNTAQESGGAFFMEGSSPSFVECRFYENEAGEGGALKLMLCDAVFEACEFIGNAAADEGGGVHAELGGSVRLQGCLLESNTSGVGGAFRVEWASLSVNGCRFAENVSSLAGGAVACWGDTEAEITGTLFSGNRGGFLGGAILATSRASVHVSGCTFAENEAAAGGGLACAGHAATTLEYTIVAFSEEGDAVHCEEGGVATLACCDLFGNAGGDWVGLIALQYGMGGNVCEDPLFCLDDNPDEPYSLSDDSHCAPRNNPACGLIGARDVGCSGTPVRPMSWGEIKAMFR